MPTQPTASEEFHISRYPTTQIDLWTLRNGTRLTLRPVLPQDGPLLGDLVNRLSPEARGQRFHGGVHHLTESRLAEMTHVDYQRHVAFVIATGHGAHEQVLADARYYLDTDEQHSSAEFALMVDDRWQHIGLGTRAMLALIGAASDAGLHWLHGDVLAHNRRMLALMRRCQFCVTPDPEDENLVHAEVSLRHHAAQTALVASHHPRPARAAARLWRWMSQPALLMPLHPLSSMRAPLSGADAHTGSAPHA
jgi:RimJ/RimL family protein N-acetyltransferase